MQVIKKVVASAGVPVSAVLNSWRGVCLVTGIVTENNALWLGAGISDELRTQNNNHLGPLFPEAQVM